MDDLRSLVRAAEESVVAPLTARAEFDGIGAHRAVRMRRVTRSATAIGLSLLIAVGAGGGVFALVTHYGEAPVAIPTLSASPITTPSPRPSLDPTPTTEPSESATPVPTGPCPSRADSMDAATAAEVAANPSTGETWLGEPEPINSPDGGPSDWYLFGHREDNEILALRSGPSSYLLAERSPQGDLEWIPNPTPGSTLDNPDLANGEPYGYPINSAQCYESLAVPTTIELADGVEGTLPNAFDDSAGAWIVGGTTHVLATYGSNQIVVVTGQAMKLTDAQQPDRYTAVEYSVHNAAGVAGHIAFNPLADTSQLLSGTITDFFDLNCESYSGPAVRGDDVSDSDWDIIGTARGRDVAVATPSNPYAQNRYAAYALLHSQWGDPVAPYEQFIADHGVVGVRADEGGWWLGINREYSERNWC